MLWVLLGLLVFTKLLIAAYMMLAPFLRDTDPDVLAGDDSDSQDSDDGPEPPHRPQPRGPRPRRDPHGHPPAPAPRRVRIPSRRTRPQVPATH
jgi:hypothetical protein